MNRVTGLICPDCGTALRGDPEQFVCPACKASTSVIDGVPHFLRDFPYWGEIPIRQMTEVNRRAQTGSWKSALLDYDDPEVQRASVMILNLDRANWHHLVRLPADSRVLDIGAGMGTNSHALALRYREVVAVEPVLERIQFMRQRFTQERLLNVGIVRSSIWKLPFAPGSFDLVALNGVLEWVAAGQSGDPGELQKTALQNIHRLLRPGGYVYVGIENRYVPGYFIGYPDPHCGLPFVTVLPRPLAHWYARRHGHEDGYRNYLYSSRGYRKLLQKAGFQQSEFYIASPSYNHPRYLVPLDGGASSFYLSNFGGRGGNWLHRTVRRTLNFSGLLKYLEYSYAILARK